MRIRFAVTPPVDALNEDHFGTYLDRCEELGFDTIWLSDVPLGPSGDPLVHLSYAAARTNRLKLGMNVVPLGRNPLWLAKQLAQLDRLSNGRLLLSFVPGLGSPTERAALATVTGDRGRDLDLILDLVRRWWNGESVSETFGTWTYNDVHLKPVPLQTPLEVWLGGIGPVALDRVARLADGWLTAAATPAEASAGREVIQARAAELGRSIDPEHFGISIPYARTEPSDATVEALQSRRPDRDISGILPVGTDGLTRLLRAHIDGGLTKFVLRPVARPTDETWHDELTWLADTVLPLQT